ncbi:hypothetical protein [Aureivirga sp. CE67]|uniref:hypothetical protein n=1 Tax=Aureivirga sp. CE67 TaxID=1788983 RepID=UPI0018CB4BE7|nr:hypothetical protein [Aureivirga sp. CE67]
MKLFILKTDIKTEEKVKKVNDLFQNDSEILKWTFDMEDIDKVLRIEASDNASMNAVIGRIKTLGFNCSELN